MANTYAVTSMRKENGQLIFEVKEKNNIIFDLATNICYSYTGRAVKTFPKSTYGDFNNKIEEYAYRLLKNAYDTDERNHNAHKLDIWLSYPDLLENALWNNLPNECPKGFVKWLKENNKCLSQNSLQEFNMFKRLKAIPIDIKEFVDSLDNHLNQINKQNLLKQPVEKIKLILKIIKTTMKSLCWTLERDINDFVFFTCAEGYRNVYFGNSQRLIWEDKLWQYFDPNRTIQQNYDNIDMIQKEHMRKAISEKQSVIKEIEKLSNDNFTIVVPVDLEEFTDEGKQQNNCVGHYYHQSIVDGYNLIYFIRKTATPTKSYVTNRFNIGYWKTVETRVFNNGNCKDNEVWNLIEKIDEKINKILKGA